jgi:hypothetical protein
MAKSSKVIITCAITSSFQTGTPAGFGNTVRQYRHICPCGCWRRGSRCSFFHQASGDASQSLAIPTEQCLEEIELPGSVARDGHAMPFGDFAHSGSAVSNGSKAP